MVKTRAKKVTKPSTAKKETSGSATSSAPTLAEASSNPPNLLILPKNAGPEARVISLPNPASSISSRYFVCPGSGFYEFTRIAAPKKACRSWLLAPKDHKTGRNDGPMDESQTEQANEGYVLEKPDLMVATPVDPLFVLLPMLADGEQGSYLTFADYVYSTEKQGWEHLHQLLRKPGFADLERKLEQRMTAVCDSLDMGDGGDKMYQLSRAKLLSELAKKARKMVERGLPASVEDRFVKQALEVPVLSIRREESSISVAAEDATPGADSQETSIVESQVTNDSATTGASAETAATSVASPPATMKPTAPDEGPNLLRLRTALSFILTSYVPATLRVAIQSALASASSPIDFSPLDKHLAHLADLKKQAQALRSLSDNISRKRSAEDDEEALEKAEAKKQKKEEEEFKKKNLSRGVQQLAKADTSGMKKLSSFFTKAPSKKK